MDAAGPAPELSVDDRLRAVGLRATRPRRLVYEALRDLGHHRTADELDARVTATGAHLSRASVYNALDALRAAGVVAVATTGPGAARYELAGAHHHFVCRVCAAILDVPCEAVHPGRCAAADVPGAVVDEVQIILRGTCARCAGTVSPPPTVPLPSPRPSGVV